MNKKPRSKTTKYSSNQRKMIIWDKVYIMLLQIAKFDNTDVAKAGNSLMQSNIRKELDKRGLVPECTTED